MRTLVLFVVALFGAPWILERLLNFVLPPPSGDLFSFLARLVPSVWSPTIIALVFVGVAGGAGGVKHELKARLRYQRGSARWLLLAVALPAFAVALAGVSARAGGHGSAFTPFAGLVPMIGTQIITGAVGEELGWRGFLLTRLRNRIGVLASFWVMGILWSLWHIPAFFSPDLPHRHMPALLVLPFIAFFGVFLAFVFARAGESVVPTIVAHLSLNIMLGVGGYAFSSAVFWGALAGIFGVTAFLISVWSRARPVEETRPAQVAPAT